MRLRRAGIAVFAAVSLATTAGLTRHAQSRDLTVHEWGTFTSVAGSDGGAIDWLALGGPSDLPCFVRHVQAGPTAPAFSPNANGRVTAPANGIITKGEVVVGTNAALSYEEAREKLWGKVRMETPVIYFYSPDERDAQVSVAFHQGVITEFFPSPVNPTAPFNTVSLRAPGQVHSLKWNVKLVPGSAESYPTENDASHYYAARSTDATPVHMGVESEKFIFYRGVANFAVPVRAIPTDDDSVVIVNALGDATLPGVILFESRGGHVGYRVIGDVAKSVTVARPKLDKDIPSLRADLHKLLVSAGLYPKEATAMLDTWRDSWFEEGTRVFYLYPEKTINAILPLSITPQPASVARVFVGRMEVIDRTTVSAVTTALQLDDQATLARYARFLNPITDRILARSGSERLASQVSTAANAAYSKYNRQLRACE